MADPKKTAERVRAQAESREEQATRRREREVTEVIPPTFAGVMTEMGCDAVDFPFPAGKALELQPRCGPVRLKLWVDPDFAEAICAEIMEAATKARTGLVSADLSDIRPPVMG